MKLILLGTSGYHPSDRRHTPCLAIPSCGVVLDAGTGMYRLGRYLKTDELDIFLTHAHLDHVIGLSYLIQRDVGASAASSDRPRLARETICSGKTSFFPRFVRSAVFRRKTLG